LQILENIRTMKRRLLPNGKMILFGSQARGDARPDSDWDLLVLHNKKKRSFAENYNEFGYPFSEIGDKFGTYISVKVYNEKEWYKKPSLFRYNIEKEGVEII